MRHVGDLGNVHTDRFGHTKIRVNDRQVIIILIVVVVVVVIIIIVITIIIASMNSMMIINDEQALLEGPHTIIGRAIVIHTGEYRMLIKTGPAFETDQNETCDSADDDQL